MEGDAPSWADQWGPGGIGVMVEEDRDANKKGTSNGKAGRRGGGGLKRAKGAIIVGAQKIKSGASNSVKWVKKTCRRKGSTQ